MKNISLKEHRSENDYFETKVLQFSTVVEFRIENFDISDFLEGDQKEDFWASLFEWTIINVITVLWSSCLILSLPLLLNICIFNSNKHFRYRNYKSKFFIIRHLKILIT